MPARELKDLPCTGREPGTRPPSAGGNGGSCDRHSSSCPMERRLGVPSRRAAHGSMQRLAEGERGGDPVVQRPRQVVFGDRHNVLIDTMMVDRIPRNRPVERRASQGACDEVLPWGGVAGTRRCQPSGYQWCRPGRFGSPRPSSAQFVPRQPRSGRQMATCERARPVTCLTDCGKRERTRRQSVVSAADFTDRGRAARLVSPSRRPVQPLVHGPEAVRAARVGRVGVVDDSVLERERAHACPVVAPPSRRAGQPPDARTGAAAGGGGAGRDWTSPRIRPTAASGASRSVLMTTS
jgi:hypothetical protein